MQFYYTLSIRYKIAYVKFKHPVYFGGGGGPVLKHRWAPYDFNKVKLSGRDKKQLPIIRVTKSSMQTIQMVLLCMMQTTLIQQ